MKHLSGRKHGKAMQAFLLAVTALLWIVTAAFCFTSVFGWFVESEGKIGSNSVNIKFKDRFSSAEYTVYAYDLNRNRAVTEYISDDGTEGDSISVAAIEFQPYDRTFMQDNVYTPVFVRIKLPADELSPSGTVRMIINRNPTPQIVVGGAMETLEDDSVAESLASRCSGIMRFSLGINKTLAEVSTINGAEDKTALYEAVAEFNSGASAPPSATFVTKTVIDGRTVYVKSENIILTASYTPSDRNGDYIILYLYIRYDEDLIDDYISGIQDVGQTGLGGDVMINDLVGIVTVIE